MSHQFSWRQKHCYINNFIHAHSHAHTQVYLSRYKKWQWLNELYSETSPAGDLWINNLNHQIIVSLINLNILTFMTSADVTLVVFMCLFCLIKGETIVLLVDQPCCYSHSALWVVLRRQQKKLVPGPSHIVKNDY